MASSSSAKWDDRSHRIFVELCVNEVMKGNRPNTTLSHLGWENVHGGFNTRTKKNYTIKQLKNHWDSMKADHQLFKQLRRGFTGLGWDEVNKTISAPAAWWDERIEKNPKFRRFRVKDLSVEQETYVPPTSISDTDNNNRSNFTGEDNNYWLGLRDAIANSISSR